MKNRKTNQQFSRRRYMKAPLPEKEPERRIRKISESQKPTSEFSMVSEWEDQYGGED